MGDRKERGEDGRCGDDEQLDDLMGGKEEREGERERERERDGGNEEGGGGGEMREERSRAVIQPAAEFTHNSSCSTTNIIDAPSSCSK